MNPPRASYSPPARPFALVPEDRHRGPPDRSLIRAAAAHMRAKATSDFQDVEAMCKALYPSDASALAILKAAVDPATTTGSGWADSVAVTAVASFVESLSPVSAGAEVLRRGLQVSLAGVGSMRVPTMLAAATNAAWVAEGSPIPVEQLTTLSGPSLAPRKLAAIVVLTRELAEHSSAEAFIRDQLSQSASLTLDNSLFDATAGSASRPAGLRNGISGLTPTAGGGLNALHLDLYLLHAAIADVGKGERPLYIVSPERATKIAAQLVGGTVYGDVLASSGVADTDIIALIPSAVVSGFDPVPEFNVTRAAVVHHEDTTPLPIGAPGPVLAAPSRSLWQTDSIGLRMTMKLAWALRHSGGLAWMTSVTW